MTAGFLDIETVVVPRGLADESQEHLRMMGAEGCEGFALWAGVRDGTRFRVTETIIPEQEGLRYAEGVCVRVDGAELFRLNMYLYEHHLNLVAQLHSHPSDAFHSETDDTFPIATTTGALSLVIPNFAVDDFSVDTCAVYRLFPVDGWTELSAFEASRLISVVE
jgi:hypothetical protein